MALVDVYFTQTATRGDDPFGDSKTGTSAVLAPTSIRIDPGTKTIVLSLGIYNTAADYAAGERPIWRTGISIGPTAYDPDPDEVGAWGYAAYRPAYSTILPYLEVNNATSVFKVQVEGAAPDIDAWILMQPAPNDPTQALSQFFTNGSAP